MLTFTVYIIAKAFKEKMFIAQLKIEGRHFRPIIIKGTKKIQ